MAISKFEASLMKRYLERVPTPQKATFSYELPEEGRVFSPEVQESERKMILSLQAKKIDALLQYPNYDEIVEVKPKLVMSALGQLLTYKNLYLKKIGYSKNIRLTALCEVRDKQIEPSFHAAGISIVVV